MWKPSCPGLVTNEGPSAVQETIDYLKTVTGLTSLGYQPEMQGIVNSHANYLGKKGILAHNSANGDSSGKRIFSVVKTDFAAENIYCGQKSSTAEDIVLALVIDDGVPSRGH